MPALMTRTELFSLFPAKGNAETEAARGQFLAALRFADAILPRRTLARLRAWNQRRGTAAALEALPDAMLRDIGLARGEIRHFVESAATEAQPAPTTAPGRPRGLAPGRPRPLPA